MSKRTDKIMQEIREWASDPNRETITTPEERVADKRAEYAKYGKLGKRLIRSGYDPRLQSDHVAIISADWWYANLDPADRTIVDGLDDDLVPEYDRPTSADWLEAYRDGVRPTRRGYGPDGKIEYKRTRLPAVVIQGRVEQIGDKKTKHGYVAPKDQASAAKTERVERVLAKLKPRYVDIMRAKHIEGKTYQEVADIADNTDRSSARKLVKRAEAAFLRAWAMEK